MYTSENEYSVSQDHTCQNCYSDLVIFQRLMTAFSLIYIEHYYAGWNGQHPGAATRNTHHGAAWICSHSSYSEGRAPCGYWDPCHSNSYHSCKHANPECFCPCDPLSQLYYCALSHIGNLSLINMFKKNI